MAKRRRCEDVSPHASGTTTAVEGDYHTLFVDTSIGTHMATVISDSATVADIKRKIVQEHSQLFPQVGEISILSLQVKRLGNFYHLPDSMPVVSAYVGSKLYKSLFLEVSSSEHGIDPEVKGRKLLEASDHKIVAIETSADHASQGVSCIEAQAIASKNHLLLPSEEAVCDPIAELGNTRTLAIKHPSSNTDHLRSPIVESHDKNDAVPDAIDQVVHIGSLGSIANGTDEDVVPSGSCKFSDQNEAEGTKKASSIGHKVFETSKSTETLISAGTMKKVRAKKKVSGVQTSSIGARSEIADASSTPIASDVVIKNIVISTTDKEIAKDGYDTVEVEKGCEENLFKHLNPVDNQEMVPSEAGDVHSVGRKRKRRKTKESAVEVCEDRSKMVNKLVAVTTGGNPPVVQDVTTQNQMTDDNNKSKSDLQSIETGQADKIAVENGASSEQGSKVKVPTAASKSLGLCDKNMDKNSSDTTVMTCGSKDLKSSGQPKKKKTKKSSGNNQVPACLVPPNIENGLLRLADTLAKPVVDEGIKATSESVDVSASVAQVGRENVVLSQEVISPSIGMYAKQVPACSEPPNTENDLRVTDTPAELVVDVGIKATSESVDVSASVVQLESDKVVLSQEKTVARDESFREVEITQSRDDKGGACEKLVNQPGSNVNRKKTSKRKKDQISDMKEHDSSVEKSIAKPHFEIEKRTGIELESAKPEVSSKERLETEITDLGNSVTAQGSNEKINFRHYFVSGKSQGEVGSTQVKAREASQSMKPKRKKQNHNAGETESMLKSREIPGNGKSSDGTNDIDTKLGKEYTDKQNNKKLPSSKKKILKASLDGVKAQTTGDDVAGNKTLETAVKPSTTSRSGGIGRAAPSRLKDKNGPQHAGEVVQNYSNGRLQSGFNHNALSTKKGSSGRSLLKRAGQEKNLLSAERKLFTSSSESSYGDENEKLDSDASTRTPSENSSSSSSSSSAESGWSQDSKLNGPENAKTKDGGKMFPVLGEDTSIEEVLKMSSRYKKALTASQSQDFDSEDWPGEFVPDSQANV